MPVLTSAPYPCISFLKYATPLYIHQKYDYLEDPVLTHSVEECGIIQHYKGSDHIGQSECHRVSAHGLLLCPTFFPPLVSFSLSSKWLL